MPKDAKGQSYRKGDYLIYTEHAIFNDAVLLFKSEGCFTKMSIMLRERVQWPEIVHDSRYMSLVKVLNYGNIPQQNVITNWVGQEGFPDPGTGLLKIPKRLCEPEIKTAEIIAFVHLAGYTYTGNPY